MISKKSFFIISQIIKKQKLHDPYILERKFNEYKEIDFLYNFNYKIISTKQIMNQKFIENKTKQNNITKDFYLGLGDIF